MAMRTMEDDPFNLYWREESASFGLYEVLQEVLDEAGFRVGILNKTTESTNPAYKATNHSFAHSRTDYFRPRKGFRQAANAVLILSQSMDSPDTDSIDLIIAEPGQNLSNYSSLSRIAFSGPGISNSGRIVKGTNDAAAVLKFAVKYGLLHKESNDKEDND